jgi:hypothetical protein
MLGFPEAVLYELTVQGLLNWYNEVQYIPPLGSKIPQPGSSQAQPYGSCRILVFLAARVSRAYHLTENAPIAGTVEYQKQYDFPGSEATMLVK